MRRARGDRRDCDGQRLRPGDRVRVLAVPDLTGMAKRPRAETARVFQHLVGTYRRVDSFDHFGFVRLLFRVRRGRLKGLHSVGIEPRLLRRVGGSTSSRPLERAGSGRRSTPPR